MFSPLVLAAADAGKSLITVTPEMLQPIQDTLQANIQQILPFGIIVFAALFVIKVIPSLLSSLFHV